MQHTQHARKVCFTTTTKRLGIIVHTVSRHYNERVFCVKSTHTDMLHIHASHLATTRSFAAEAERAADLSTPN